MEKVEIMQKKLMDFAFILFGAALYSIGIVCFAVPADFAPGGVTGLAVILSRVTSLPVGTLILLLNIPIILLTIRFLGRKFMFGSFVVMVIVSLFTDLLFVPLPVYDGNRMLGAVFAGACVGVGLALLYNKGTSTGGADFVIMAARKLRPHMSIGQLFIITDLTVVLVGAVVFREFEAVLYGIVYLFVSAQAVDRVIVGFTRTKLALCVTVRPDEVASSINDHTGRGCTIIRARGGYSGTERFVVMCTCSNHQYAKLKAAVLQVDSGAFVIMTEASGVYGEGFHTLNF